MHDGKVDKVHFTCLFSYLPGYKYTYAVIAPDVIGMGPGTPYIAIENRNCGISGGRTWIAPNAWRCYHNLDVAIASTLVKGVPPNEGSE